MLIPRNIVEVSSWETDEGNVQAAAHFEIFFFFGGFQMGRGSSSDQTMASLSVVTYGSTILGTPLSKLVQP